MLSHYEKRFGLTIHRTRSIAERIEIGTPYKMDDQHIAIALEKTYKEPPIVDKWALPPGAFGESCGPT